VKLQETRCRLVEDAKFLVPQFFEAYVFLARGRAGWLGNVEVIAQGQGLGWGLASPSTRFCLMRWIKQQQQQQQHRYSVIANQALTAQLPKCFHRGFGIGAMTASYYSCAEEAMMMMGHGELAQKEYDPR
jgi:hypothetical protein